MPIETSEPSSDRQQGGLWRVLPLAAFVIVAALFGYALFTGDPSKLPSTFIGRPVPDTTFSPLEGLTSPAGAVPGFGSADLGKGEAAVVNFFASWCLPCVDEHPQLGALASKGGVKIFGVNYKDSPDAARRFLGRYGNPYAAVGTDFNGRGAIEWGVYGMPETFVVDGAGKIVYKQVGPITPEILEAKILPAVAAAKSGPQPNP
ncbi:MAG: DsbE family thiol:disulfide interchange protein [Hyphomicrobium sp.]|nr:DsbE family thiol:disulfide interchange protein [Hyphomicrobium sp.]